MSGIAASPFEVQTRPDIMNGGIHSYQQAADILADMGRYGDTYIVHAAEGETVIPLEVLEANPRMKKMIFKQMEEMGLDPQRYIVGSELNSINPATGQPEFFLKKLFKGLKKIVKKVAPIILPIVAPYLLPTMPMWAAAGLGSFTGNLIGGAKPKDALKSALFSAATGAIGAKMGGGSFGGTYKDMYGGGLSLTGGPEGSPIMGAGRAGEVASNVSDGTKNFFNKYIYDPAPNVLKDGKIVGQGTLESYLSPSRVMLDSAGNQLPVDKISAFKKYAPMVGAGLGAVGVIDALSADKDEEPKKLPTGMELIRKDIDDGTFQYAFDPYKFYGGSKYYPMDTFKPYYEQESYNSQTPLPIAVAGGGPINGPGTSTSDSIPAMLSDGEFVMNAKAVRGAGGGDRKAGAQRMYAMMNKFERMAG